MGPQMYSNFIHAATNDNVELLKTWKYTKIQPENQQKTNEPLTKAHQ